MGHAISHATLSNYETGRSIPPLAILDALAVVYERSRDWFYAVGPAFSPGIRYRSLKAVRVGDKRSFEGEALGWFTAYLAVENLVSDPPARAPRDFTIDPADSGESVAKRIRKFYALDRYPLPSAVRLAENFRVRVIQLATEARIDGFAAMLGKVPVVAVNSGLSNDRMRMNVAHELAHHLFSDCVAGESLSEAEVEKRATECGSYLLIPDDALKDAFKLKSMVRLAQYKERYGVSLAAMIYRARRARLITEREYQHLWIEFSRLGWRKDEPGYVAPDRPIRMEALFDAAVRTNKTTFAEIATLAGMDERVVRRRVMSAFGGASDAIDGRRELNPMRIDAYRADESRS